MWHGRQENHNAFTCIVKVEALVALRIGCQNQLRERLVETIVVFQVSPKSMRRALRAINGS